MRAFQKVSRALDAERIKLSNVLQNAYLLEDNEALESFVDEWCAHSRPNVLLHRLAVYKFRVKNGVVQFKGDITKKWFSFDKTLPKGQRWFATRRPTTLAPAFLSNGASRSTRSD